VYPTRKLNLSTRSGPSWRAVLALTLGVSVLHAWLLAAGPSQLTVTPAMAQAVTLHTRTVPAAADLQAPAPRVSSRAVAANPRTEEAGTVAPPAPAPATISAGVTEALPPGPGPVEPSLPEPVVAAATDERPPAAPAPASPAPIPSPSPPADAQTPAPAPPPPNARPSGTAVAISIPGSIRLRYQVTGRARGFELSASGQLDWQHDGQRYQSRLAINSFPLPSRVQTSVGEITPEGLSPRRFSDRTRSEVAVHFQPDLGRVVFSNNSPQAVWTPGLQDRLSVLLQLSALIAGDPARFEPGLRISLPTVGGRELEPWDFTVVGRETLKLPAGEQEAVLLRREPRHAYDATVEVWFAPALAYLPVRLVLTQANGDRLDQQLSGTEKP